MLLLHTIIPIQFLLFVAGFCSILLFGTIIFTIYFNIEVKKEKRQPLLARERLRNFTKGLCWALVFSVLYVMIYSIYFSI